MKPIEFVEGVRKSVVEENHKIYVDLFQNTDQASDPYWITALRFFKSLSIEQRKALFEIIRQVEVDTVSNMFAILDGVSWVENQVEEITLIENTSQQQLSGSLQDLFLGLENG